MSLGNDDMAVIGSGNGDGGIFSGDITVGGDANISGDLIVDGVITNSSGPLIVNPTTYLQVGAGIPTYATASDDLYVAGKLEVHDSVAFKGAINYLSHTNNVAALGNDFRAFGAYVNEVYFKSGDFTKRTTLKPVVGSGFHIAPGGSGLANNNVVICPIAYSLRVFDHALNTDPTLYVQSATDPDVDNTEWLSLAFSSVSGNANITTGKGALQLGSDTCVPVWPSLTTTQRNAVTPINGMQLYNTTTSTMQAYSNGAWVETGY